MLQIEDLKQELQAQQPKIEYLKEALGYENLLKEKRELDEQAAKPDFWNDVENTKQVLKHLVTTALPVPSTTSLSIYYSSPAADRP